MTLQSVTSKVYGRQFNFKEYLICRRQSINLGRLCFTLNLSYQFMYLFDLEFCEYYNLLLLLYICFIWSHLLHKILSIKHWIKSCHQTTNNINELNIYIKKYKIVIQRLKLKVQLYNCLQVCINVNQWQRLESKVQFQIVKFWSNLIPNLNWNWKWIGIETQFQL